MNLSNSCCLESLNPVVRTEHSATPVRETHLLLSHSPLGYINLHCSVSENSTTLEITELAPLNLNREGKI